MGNERKHASNFTIAIGIVQCVGDLYSPKVKNASKGEEFKTTCPDCVEPTPPEQLYRCPSGHEHPMGDLGRARQVDDRLVAVSLDEVKEARASKLPPNLLEISVHRADEVAGKVIPEGSSYVFRPSPTALQQYGLFLDILEKRTDLILMGMCNMRNNDKLMHLTCTPDKQFMLTELVWPSDVEQFEPIGYSYKPTLLKQAEAYIESAVTEFDADIYKKESRDRIAELIAKAAGEKPKATSKAKVAKSDDNDLEALLTAALSSQKKKAS